MTFVNHDQALLDALQAACDYCEAQGVDVSASMKRRDKREPGRREKEQAELRLERLMRRIFRKQSAKVEAWLQQQYPSMPLKFTDSDLQYLLDFQDDEEMGELILQFIEAAQGGVNIFANRAKIGFDWTLVNAEAAKRAKEYAYSFIKDLDAVTLRILQDTISAFVEVPGFTIRDVIDRLPFDQTRAEKIAITEITNAYAKGELDAGHAMAKEFPDVRIEKTWYTNNDDRVCEICAPLNGMTVELDEGFTTEDGEGLDGPAAHVNCRCWIETAPKLVE